MQKYPFRTRSWALSYATPRRKEREAVQVWFLNQTAVQNKDHREHWQEKGTQGEKCKGTWRRGRHWVKNENTAGLPFTYRPADPRGCNQLHDP